jgi:isoleucyl-tRNA synthetase
MSKSKGNVVDPWEMFEQFGADTIRMYLLASSQVWLPKRFDPRTIPEVAGKFFNALKNSYNFFAGYAGEWTPAESPAIRERPLVDRWLLSRLDATVEAVSQAWNGYDVTAGVRAIMDFVVDDVSQWYVRVNRARFWAPDSTADPAALATLHETLATVARLLAPAAPFASDWMHRGLTGTSVHLAPFPVPRGQHSPELEGAMDAIRRLASLARSAREERNIRVRQPLGRMQVAVPGGVRGRTLEELLELLRLEVNVKNIEVVASDTDLVRLRPKPNFRSLGKRYGKRTPAVAAATATLTPVQLRGLEAGTPATLELEGEPVTYLPEDVAVEREVATDWLVQSNGAYVAALDPQLDEVLRREGLAREVVNRVQRIRKEAGYSYTDRIALWIDGDPPVIEAVKAHAGFIRGETLARGLEISARAPDPDLEQRVDMDGHGAVVGVQRYQDGRPYAAPQTMD